MLNWKTLLSFPLCFGCTNVKDMPFTTGTDLFQWLRRETPLVQQLEDSGQIWCTNQVVCLDIQLLTLQQKTPILAHWQAAHHQVFPSCLKTVLSSMVRFCLFCTCARVSSFVLKESALSRGPLDFEFVRL